MKPREIVGYRIRQERTRLGMSQAELGRVVSRLLGTTWYPQTVGAAEKGERAFTVEDMLVLTIALQVDLNTLTTAPPGETMDLGPHRFTDWDEQPDVPPEDRLVADADRAIHALRDYLKNAAATPKTVSARASVPSPAVQVAKEKRKAKGKR